MTPSIQKALESFENFTRYCRSKFVLHKTDCCNYYEGVEDEPKVDMLLESEIKDFLTTALEEIARAEYARGLEEAGCYNTCLDCEKPLWKHKCNQMKK